MKFLLGVKFWAWTEGFKNWP